MNSHEYTDPDGDALTITQRLDAVWFTCTKGDEEVTVGPFPTAAIRAAFDTPMGDDDMEGGVTAALIEQETECGYCHHPTSGSCGIEDGPTRYRCNRRQGHAGDHVACADSDHYLAVWDSPQEPETVDLGEQELTLDTLDDDVVQRALNAWHGRPRRSTVPHSVNDWARMLSAVRAALTPPSARPEGAEEIEAILSELPDTELPITDAGRADLLAERGVRKVEDGGVR